MNNFLWIGESAALGAAFLWAASSIVYTRLGATLSPLLLNSLKGLVAIALLVLTLFILQPSMGSISLKEIILLSFSGIVGIGIGDTAYFSALRCLGARRTLLMETLSPIIAAIMAMMVWGENISIREWGGMGLTLAGVAWVITERTGETGGNHLQWKQGIVWGILAAMCQASGAVLSRYALIASEMSPLWSSLIRLMAGTIVVLLLWAFIDQMRARNRISLSSRSLGVISLTAFGSTYLGIWLQQISLKFAATGIAQTLSATSPLFVLPLAYCLGEKISQRAINGVIIALLGISLIFLGGR
ncbi:MAG: DMT family transporter [Microcystaceae cyanobacterium]